jgi:PAS domain S-box-containing protein
VSFKNISIKNKLILLIVSITVFLTTLSLSVIAVLDINSKKEDLLNNGRLQAKLISQYVKVAIEFDDSTWAKHVIEKLSDIPDVLECNIYRADGSIFADYETVSTPHINSDINTIEDNSFTNGVFYIKEEIINEGKSIGTVLLINSTKRLNDSKQIIAITMLLTLLTIIILGYVIAVKLQKLISKPIVDLADSMEGITDKDNYLLPVTYKSDDEIGVLYKKFTQMLSTISERSDEIRKARSYLNSVIDSMPSMLVGIDNRGKITSMNKSAEEKIGKNREDVLGEDVGKIFVEYQSLIEELLSTIKSGAHFSKNGIEELHGDINDIINFSAFPLSSTGIEGAVIRIDNVTREFMMEQELSQGRKMDAIGQLAGGVAHDFNNMLGGIMGAAELLQFELTDSSDKAKEFLSMILKTSERAADLTKKLLAFGRKGNITSTAIDIHSILNDTLAILERSVDKKVTISVTTKAEKSFVIGDDSALQNALMNLGINAGHAMEKEGGELAYTTRNTILSREYCNVSTFPIKPGNFIEVEIRDNGTGITEDNLKKIFEPFFTTKEEGKGTGLGLAAVYGTVTDHHGAITVYSELGTGTVFHIFLPADETVILPKIEESREISRGAGRILLIDDEEIIRVSGKYMLQEMGYEVILAENGMEALKIFKQDPKSINVVISDMIMPKMNGSETFYKLREIDPNCSVVISSGFTKDESLHQLKADGLKGFLNKPYRMQELNNVLSEILMK